MLASRWDVPAAIAHRGSRYLWPENTMDAFDGAVRLGYRALETDLHITSDGVLVCIHDHTVDRTTNGSGPIGDYRFARLSKLDAGFRHRGTDGHSFRGHGLSVPAFEELATSFPDALLIVDLKTDGLVEPLARVIASHRLADRIIVGSFSDARIARFMAVTGGKVPTSTGPGSTRSWLVASRFGRGGRGDPSAIQVPVQLRGLRIVDRRLVEAAHARGIQVHVWTVNEKGEMERLLDLGVDGLITDRVDTLRDVLVARGQWHSG